ncbi:MAG: hypothetical protein ABJC51_03415 [Acidobacteriota bacterium]
MLSKGAIVMATSVGIVVAAALVGLFGVPTLIGVSTGFAAAAYAATVPWALSNGRFPGPQSNVRARRVTNLASALIVGCALVGVVRLDVDRSVRIGLQLLVLAVGTAGFSMGSAAALLDTVGEAAEADKIVDSI